MRMSFTAAGSAIRVKIDARCYCVIFRFQFPILQAAEGRPGRPGKSVLVLADSCSAGLPVSKIFKRGSTAGVPAARIFNRASRRLCRSFPTAICASAFKRFGSVSRPRIALQNIFAEVSRRRIKFGIVGNPENRDRSQ